MQKKTTVIDKYLLEKTSKGFNLVRYRSKTTGKSTVTKKVTLIKEMTRSRAQEVLYELHGKKGHGKP